MCGFRGRRDGLESDPVEFFTAVKEIASADGATGWVSSVVGVHPWQIGLFPDEAQQAVWGEDDPGAAVARFNQVFALPG